MNHKLQTTNCKLASTNHLTFEFLISIIYCSHKIKHVQRWVKFQSTFHAAVEKSKTVRPCVDASLHLLFTLFVVSSEMSIRSSPHSLASPITNITKFCVFLGLTRRWARMKGEPANIWEYSSLK